MYLPACGTFLVVGLILNILDLRMLALTVLVSLNIFLPIPADSAEEFYFCCVLLELAVGVNAYLFCQKPGLLVAHISGALVITHCMGFALDGYPPFSPYHLIVKLLEFSQILACVALSPVLAPILRNRDATTT